MQWVVCMRVVCMRGREERCRAAVAQRPPPRPAQLSCLLSAQNPTQPKEIATANAIGQAVLGSLCLMKGFDCC